MNLNSMPSLSAYLDTKLKVEVVPGRVTDMLNHLYITFSIDSETYQGMTPDELYKLYFKPAVRALAERVNALGNVKTKALKLPPKKNAVVGFRCLNGKIPVRVSIARRPDPDRHMIIVDVLVQSEIDPDEA